MGWRPNQLLLDEQGQVTGPLKGSACEEAGALVSGPFETPKPNWDSWNPSTLSIGFRTYVLRKTWNRELDKPCQLETALPAVWLQRHGKSLTRWPEPTVLRVLDSKVSSGRQRCLREMRNKENKR